MKISNNKLARITGLIYLGVVLTGIFTLMYMPSKLFGADTASLTYQQIASSQLLLRLGILSGLLCYTFFLFLPLALYKLLKQVNENYAKLMVLLALLSVPVYFLNVQNLFSILSVIINGQSKFGLSVEQAHSQVMLYIDQYNNGMRLVHIFSGLWLFPFGYLVYQSGILPKVLGVFLILGCFGYLINFVGNTLFSNYSQFGISSIINLPASIGEIGTCLWLLIRGAKNYKIAES
ncbi:MAG: DUF4386 domain-containing protein [Bacteroidetes bacterium]|nr:DUF4386 domain-containing protein [Bacteroidota bacterium]